MLLYRSECNINVGKVGQRIQGTPSRCEVQNPREHLERRFADTRWKRGALGFANDAIFE